MIAFLSIYVRKSPYTSLVIGMTVVEMSLHISEFVVSTLAECLNLSWHHMYHPVWLCLTLIQLKWLYCHFTHLLPEIPLLHPDSIPISSINVMQLLLLCSYGISKLALSCFTTGKTSDFSLLKVAWGNHLGNHTNLK